VDDHAAQLVPDGEGGWDVYYPLQDRMAHVVALADASGAVVERYNYAPYGELTITDEAGTTDRTAAGSSYGNPYTYTGRYWDADAGLYYYRHRWYSADLGRFTTRDPAGYVDGASLYQYGSASPIQKYDPSGLGEESDEVTLLMEQSGCSYSETVSNQPSKPLPPPHTWNYGMRQGGDNLGIFVGIDWIIRLFGGDGIDPDSIDKAGSSRS
jgi:RHS repeat-associated protein